jgi:hypothetical protein
MQYLSGGGGAIKRKRTKLGAYNEMKKILLEWFQQMCSLAFLLIF